jgi:hypothetical protein
VGNVPKQNLELPRWLKPGEVDQIRLDISDTEIDQLLSERQWAVVETGLRQYIARVVDNRPS